MGVRRHGATKQKCKQSGGVQPSKKNKHETANTLFGHKASKACMQIKQVKNSIPIIKVNSRDLVYKSLAIEPPSRIIIKTVHSFTNLTSGQC